MDEKGHTCAANWATHVQPTKHNTLPVTKPTTDGAQQVGPSGAHQPSHIGAHQLANGADHQHAPSG
ncbi:hypothetical protein L195_g062600, partial [Trifolium pratense]